MTLATKRPGSTVASSGITLVGGAGSLHATLLDNSDSTYAADAANAGVGVVVFDTLSVPAGGILQYVILRLRCRKAAGDGYISANLNTGPAITIHPPTGSGWGTLGSTSQNSITTGNLSSGVQLTWRSLGTSTTDIAAAYLDVYYFPVPTLNVTAPTGTIGVTQPTVTWDYTGDFAQERFHVKVFSSAQYSGAGFNVDNTMGLYDSGEQIGSANSFVPTLNLPNSATYRFYVKVAQKVGSVTQWSAWDFTQPTVTVTPAPVPVLAVTSQSADARVQVVATDTGTPTWQFVTIERTADGGATWTAVRSADRAPVSGTSFTVYDYESGNGEVVQYRAQSVLADPAGDIASAWSASTAPTSWNSPSTLLKSLTRPALNLALNIESIPTVKRRIPRGVIDVAGRSDPIVVSDTRKWMEGTVTFITLTDSDRDQLNALLDTGETLLLQTPEADGWGSHYISCGDVDENRTSRRSIETSRTFTVPFNEVAAPVGQVVTFGSTWDDLVAGYATWTDVIAAFPSWNAVLAAQL